ncbi:hypothetical protein PsorP6_013363 [Peronosclerospora sorghi]|uniref:Uncharacterized protein n=1 Tax=Peronosclerospora sorghi TaxID=230839 RepID=A0ACC0WGB7_9STRA|nr:hypothetical protein PsorP6_013363 [Peronosclerospora sorghi]
MYTRSRVQDLFVTGVMALTDKRTPDMYPYNPTIRNWVGPLEAAPVTACYKKNEESSKKSKCPSGYHHPNDDDWAAQFRLMFPVECSSRCRAQNGDWVKATIGNVSAAARVALTFATVGVFSALVGASRGIDHAFTCCAIHPFLHAAFQVQGTSLDLLLAVCACLGIKIPPMLQFSAMALDVSSALIMMGIMINEADIFGSKKHVVDPAA